MMMRERDMHMASPFPFQIPNSSKCPSALGLFNFLYCPRKHVTLLLSPTPRSQLETSTGRLTTKRVARSPAVAYDDMGKRKMLELVDNKGSSSVRSTDNSNVGARGSRNYNKMRMRNKVKKGGAQKKVDLVPKKGYDKTEAELREIAFRVALDSCSKRGDVMGGIDLYDEATRDGFKLSQYHYSVLLYLCSSAASGVVRPAKSGSTYPQSVLHAVSHSSCVHQNGTTISGCIGISDQAKMEVPEENVQLVSPQVKMYAVKRGYEIYQRMCEENVQMNEASFTAMARIAMSMGDGDLAFGVVQQMKQLGIIPKLRSYGPALSAFCSSGNIEKAFAVERHMLEQGVKPEEPELEALLRASIGAKNGDRVYYLLHKFRTVVRRVSNTTADLIRKWFESAEAARVGKTKWNRIQIKTANENRGGGWHGQGWLGRGRWAVSLTTVGDGGFCQCCGQKLDLIDLDPLETEKFAESVASIAVKREKHSNFQKFQQWLDYYGPFEAVADAANIGLYSQHRFTPTKISAVVNGIRQMLPSKKWPLIILHNRRVTGNKMDEEVNKALVEKWKNADALYPTPTGSNDDWYWLYAAIKFKCLLVTNDEMRDHTFQLLGNDFFPKWKERHQVHFSFNETGPVFHMPPPCSVVIQESEDGHWHVPIESEVNAEVDRPWLCITRAKSSTAYGQGSTANAEETEDPSNKMWHSKTTVKNEQPTLYSENQVLKRAQPGEMYRKLKSIVSGLEPSERRTILLEIQKAEKFGQCTIDFQI
uniref:ribonuclease P n=1 Tax=Kalanchoe fedtschenkoi TaxID=63787 RepID=A0A7N0TIU4_KALFE